MTFVGSRGRDVLCYYYSAPDVFVTTPWHEPFSITPLEAAACDTPVIGGEVGGIENVADGETGYLVPPNDPDALADRMARLFRRPELIQVLGRKALRRPNALFTREKVAVAAARFYHAVGRPLVS